MFFSTTFFQFEIRIDEFIFIGSMHNLNRHPEVFHVRLPPEGDFQVFA